MLIACKPEIVVLELSHVKGHFDLIRLFCDYPLDRVWNKVQAVVSCQVLCNIQVIADYGGIVEINARAYKKGLKEAYPCKTFNDR